MRISRLAVAFVLLFGLCIPAAAQPMLDRIPADAMVYIGWQGMDSLGPAYEGSRLKAVLDASNARQLVTEFLPALVRRISQENPDAAGPLQMLSTFADPLWRHPTAVYFGGLDQTVPGQPPKLVVLCEAGADAQRMLDTANDLIRQANVPFPLSASIDGQVFMFSTLNNPVPKPQAALAGNASFTAALGQAQKGAVLTVYLDSQPLLDLINQAAANQPQAARWPAIREALGLNGLKQMIFTSGFDGKDWTSHAFVAAPAPRVGLVSLLDGKRLGDDVLKLVPKSANYVAAGNFDVSRLLKEVRAAVAKIDADAAKQLEQGIGVISMMTGANIETELIDVLGDQWAMYFASNVGGNGFLGLTLVSKLKDAAKAERTLGLLETMISNVIASQIGEGDDKPTIAFRTVKSGELTIHYLAVPFVAPAWTISNGNLYVALYPQVIASAIPASAGPSILENETFKAVRQRLAAPDASGIMYVDLPNVASEAYGFLLAYTRLGLGIADMFNVPAPALAVPPLDKLLAQLAPAGAMSRVDDAGFHYRSVSPFPGAAILGSQGQVMIGQQALLISILLPSLNRARETANRVKCASNQRQIGQAILLYSNENRGKYPQDLGTLLKTQDITIEVFVCPSSSSAIPPDVRAMPIDQQAQWVNQNSDYVYVGAGLNNSIEAERIVLYEKFTDHDRDGVNMLYGDGHVEWQMTPAAIQEMRRQNIEPQGAPNPTSAVRRPKRPWQ